MRSASRSWSAGVRVRGADGKSQSQTRMWVVRRFTRSKGSSLSLSRCQCYRLEGTRSGKRVWQKEVAIYGLYEKRGAWLRGGGAGL